MARMPSLFRCRAADRLTLQQFLGIFLVAITILVISAQPPAVRSRAAVTMIRSGLPEHFALGLANGPTDLNWMTGSGIPWDMRYQYLAGGVNTGRGWATWNRDGNFAAVYMDASAAAEFIPVFTYYQLLQSLPGTGSTEPEKVYNNLNNAPTMQAYFADFRLLLNKVRAFGKPVIIHVEPDLFGFMHQRVVDTTNSAASIPAQVAASGYPDVAGLPNTFQGFNLALLHLRDKYAPNAILAAHVSAWSTKISVTLSQSSTLDVTTIGRTTAAFHNTAGLVDNPQGISSYELLFFDPSDRDAGYYQVVHGDGGRHWWDPNNQRFPNFARYEQYITSVTQGTDRRAMLWQVPIGNTVFRTENNSDGHYQDNRVQYWLGGYPDDGHIAALAKAGVIGILFGRGAGGQSTYTDAKGDGITNPAAINGNDAIAQYSDDDGGYLRIVARRYYERGPYRFGSSLPSFPFKSLMPLVRK